MKDRVASLPDDECRSAGKMCRVIIISRGYSIFRAP
jgi:hypothetical protein